MSTIDMNKAENMNKSDMKQQAVQWNALVQETLAKAQKKGATQAEVGLSIAKGLSVTVRLGDVETVEFHQDRAFGITVYKGQQKGSASTNDLSAQAIEQALAAALRIADYAEADPYAGLAEREYLATDLSDLDMYHPETLSPEVVGQWAKQCEDAARAADKRICNSEGASFGQNESYRAYGNTNGFVGGCPSTSYSLSCAVVAKDKVAMQRDYDYTVSRILGDLNSGKAVGEEAARRAVERLNPRKIKTGRTPVIFAAEVAAGLIAHFASAISGGNLYRKSSFLLDKLHHPIFPEWMQIQEKPHIPRSLGGAMFDQEGVATQERDIVTGGILQTYLLGSYSARKLNMQTTGHAGGVHNWKVTPTVHDLSELFKRMGTGLYITELMGFGVNIVTGDYSQGVAGFWVENGAVQYPVQEITVAGHLAEMFNGMVAVGGDVDMRRNIQTGSILLDSMMVAGA